MKCPDCKLVCSDLRDICPKCLSDLRDHKVALGIPVTNSKASYQELVNRMKRLPAAPDRRFSPGDRTSPGVSVSASVSGQGKRDKSVAASAAGVAQDKPKTGLFGKLFGRLAAEERKGQQPVSETVVAETVVAREQTRPSADSVSTETPEAVAPIPEDTRHEDTFSFVDQPPHPQAGSTELPSEPQLDNPEISAEIYQSQAAAGPKVLDFSAGDDLDQVIDRLLESELESADIIGIESVEAVDEPVIEVEFHNEAEPHAPEYVEQALSAEVQNLELHEPAFEWIDSKTSAIEELVPDEHTIDEVEDPDSVTVIEARGSEYEVRELALSQVNDVENTPQSETQDIGPALGDVQNVVTETSSIDSLTVRPQMQTKEKAVEPASPDIRALFEECYRDLSSDHANSKFELSSDQLLPAAPQDEIRILFDLAYDELKSPASVQSYQEAAEIARTVRLESEELRAHLEKVEQQASDRQIGLKAPKKKTFAETSVGAAAREEGAKPRPAAFQPLGSREALAVWLVDLGVIAFAALLFGTFWLAAIDMNLLSRMMKAEELSILQIIDWFALVGVSFLVGLLLVPLLSLYLWGRSVGQIVFKCQVCDKAGADPQLRQLALRALLQPLNLLGFGWLGACFGRCMLDDWLSSTRLCRVPEAAR